MPGPMGPRPGRTTEKAKDFKGTTKKLINNYLSKYKIGLIIVFIFAVGSTIFSIIGPKILGDSIGISAFWILFSLLIFAKFLGLIGMIIGVPIFAIIYSIIKENVERRLKAKGLPVETEKYK